MYLRGKRCRFSSQEREEVAGPKQGIAYSKGNNKQFLKSRPRAEKSNANPAVQCGARPAGAPVCWSSVLYRQRGSNSLMIEKQRAQHGQLTPRQATEGLVLPPQPPLAAPAPPQPGAFGNSFQNCPATPEISFVTIFLGFFPFYREGRGMPGTTCLC